MTLTLAAVRVSDLAVLCSYANPEHRATGSARNPENPADETLYPSCAEHGAPGTYQAAAVGEAARPDAPAVTDDADARAARAAFITGAGTNGETAARAWDAFPDDHPVKRYWRRIIDAALAAAGAGEAVDREALAKAMQDEVEYRIRTAAALAKGGHSVQGEVDAGRARIAAIAARGDAATPTWSADPVEPVVEWREVQL